MTISKMAPSLGTGVVGLGSAAAVNTEQATETVPLLKVAIWTIESNGQLITVDGQTLIAICGAAVGVLGIIISLIKLIRK